MSLPHILGKRSKVQFDTLHPDLQMIIDWTLKYSLVDFTLTEGHRPVKRQFVLFKRGRQQDRGGKYTIIQNKKKIVTNIDGITKKGNHNYSPSLAVDFCVFVPDKPELTWDISHLNYIASALVMSGEYLYLQGAISHKLRWGGNWDKDGDLSDNNFFDRPHVELYKP